MPHLLESSKPLYPKTVPERFIKKTAVPLDQAQLLLYLLLEEERASLKTITTGNATLSLMYKGFEAAVLSFLASSDELQIQQLQGAHSRKSYRVHTAVSTTSLFAYETQQLVTNTPDIRRITMPVIDAIAGLDGVERSEIEYVMRRYEQLATLLALSLSREEQLLVRDITQK